jgi:hypothetical protein
MLQTGILLRKVGPNIRQLDDGTEDGLPASASARRSSHARARSGRASSSGDLTPSIAYAADGLAKRYGGTTRFVVTADLRAAITFDPRFVSRRRSS